MSDPLGMIRAAGAEAAHFRAPRATVAGAPGTPGEGPSFKDVLIENLREVDRLQQDASRTMEDLQVGRADLEQVIGATQKADTAFRMLQAVRNRVIEAYDEVKQIRV